MANVRCGTRGFSDAEGRESSWATAAVRCKNEGVTTTVESEKPPPSIRAKRRSLVRGLVKTIRPHQWVKNVFVFAPVFFAHNLFPKTSDGDPALNLKVTSQALIATFVFCLVAGAVYTINDLVDVEADRVHPVKRFRPIANGDVPEGIARLFAGALVVFALGVAFWRYDDWRFGGIAALYFVSNLAYSFKLKKIAYLDVGMIAFFFVLRVLAGGFATHTPVSMYMLACTLLIALFLGFGKRRHELESETAGKQRAALEAYGKRSLDVALAVTGLATAATYFAYTLDHDTQDFFHSHHLWLTAPFTVFGIGRFLMLVSGRAGRGRKAESPTQEMLSDVPFVLNLVLWVVVVFAIIYNLRPS